jgi:hypothetical protein
MDGDDNFMVYRGFGHIQARLLLEKHDDLRLLEEQLDVFDRNLERENANFGCTMNLGDRGTGLLFV